MNVTESIRVLHVDDESAFAEMAAEFLEREDDRIEVDTATSASEGLDRLADDGPGIPEEERERVFESGYLTTDDGTGFGLAIVKEIAEAHGWGIGVTDSADDGARFEITGVEFA